MEEECTAGLGRLVPVDKGIDFFPRGGKQIPPIGVTTLGLGVSVLASLLLCLQFLQRGWSD